MEDLYFYKGKFRTEEGIKRALIKDGLIWVSPLKNYYLYEDYNPELYYSADELEDYLEDQCLFEKGKFRKWLNSKIKEGKVKVLKTKWYHDEECGKTEFWEALEFWQDVYDRFDPKYPDEFIEWNERTIESYLDTLQTNIEYDAAEQYSDEDLMKIAMQWRIKTYLDAKKALGE